MNSTDLYKRYIKIAFVVFIFYMLSILITQYSSSLGSYNKSLLDKYVSTTVIRKDGQIENYNSNHFPVVSRGDRLIFKVPLLEQYRIKDAALVCHIYNSTIVVKYKDQELYRYGQEIKQAGYQMGSYYPRVAIPDEAFGDVLTFECEVTEDKAFSSVCEITILPAVDCTKYFLIGRTSEFYIFISLLVCSGLLLFILMLWKKKNREVWMNIWVSLFSLLISLYVLAYYGLFNVISNNVRLNANVEYISLFALPMPAIAYFSEMIQQKRSKKILHFTVIGYIVFFCICSILNYTTRDYHYSKFVLALHGIIIMELLLIIGVCLIEKNKSYHSGFVVQKGIRLFCCVILLEIIRYNIDKYITLPIGFFKLTLLTIGFIMLITFFILENVHHLVMSYHSEQERIQLEKMAYMDSLTGLMNRARCQKFLDSMKYDDIREYTIIFIDLNNLKKANDQYGHKAGDEYIRTAAGIFRQYFRDADICGRIGGDEFIVVYKGRFQGKLELLLKNVHEAFEESNKEGKFGFRMSVACGSAVSTLKNPLEISVAITIADQKMYEDKIATKAKEAADLL